MAFTPQEIWSTIRRARLIRVLVVYAGATFAVIEIIDILADQVGLPDWVVPGAVVLLLLGLPIIVATAVVQSAPSAPADKSTQFDAFARAEVGAAAERPTAEDVAAVAKHWLTWRKAILGGVLAFALLGVATTGYMTMRALGIGPVGSLVAAGVLDERDRIILADFQNHTGDPTLAATVTEAFRIDLAQSPAVTIVRPRYLREVLRRMEVDPDSPLDPALASEVAVREGIKAVVAGEINPAGSGYVLSTQLVSGKTGDVLAAFRVAADDSTAIIGAIDRLSKKLRERIGESLKTIRGNEPLERVTTSSLEALLKYSQAERAFERDDYETSITLLEEAVALDSTFAMAYRKLGVAIWSSNRFWGRTRWIGALARAYELRDRLTDRERYHAIGIYYTVVTEEYAEASAAYRALLDTYPNDLTALNNLAVVYGQLRNFAGAEELYRRAVEQDSFNALYYTNIAHQQVAQGRGDEAEATLTRLAEKLPDHPRIDPWRGALAFSRGDYDAAELHFRAEREKQAGNLRVRANTGWQLSRIASTRGRLAEAERHLRDQAAANEGRGLEQAGLSAAIQLAWLDVWHRAQPDRGLRIVEDALQRHPLAEIKLPER